MRFGILGPLEVADDQGRELALGGRKQRAVLAVLLLHAGEVISSERLIDEVWRERAPATAVKTVQVYVSNLRKALGDGVLVTRGGGYVLVVADADVDASRFQVLAAEGARALGEGNLHGAIDRLRDALRLWRGAPLSEFAYEPFAQGEIARLEEARLAAREDRIDAELALGDHSALVGELEALVREHPLRERFRGQLMLALYRAGRQADALTVYRELSGLLRDELALAPSKSLQELERSMLRQDPALGAGPRARRRQPGNLPVPATAFLGRERELAEVAELLESPDVRLLTLTGAGGSGKTRLALRVGETLAARYSDGVWFVGFADIADPGLIIPTVCQVLNVAQRPGLTPEHQLQEWLRERELLLVLDNLEQLTAGAAVLGELSSGCPGVKMLATSREPLHLTGEQQYEVSGLERDHAIELFTTRARAIRPRVNVDPDLAAAICERLDQLPLAIELAAARSKILSPAEILERLDAHLPVLSHGPRDAPRRQRTLNATIDWSHELLNDKEQRVFARLAVFAGGFTLPAAQAACQAELETLQALVDRSLLKINSERYWMLQTIRQYALEKLQESGEADEVRQLHAQWLVELLRTEGPSDVRWLNNHALTRIRPERENLRGALRWSSLRGMFQIAAQLAAPLVGIWLMTGEIREATHWMNLLLEHEDEYSPRLAAQVVSGARAVAWYRGDDTTEAQLSKRAWKLWRDLGDPEAIGGEMIRDGNAAAVTENNIRCRSAFERAARFAEEHGLSGILTAALNGLGDLAMREGRLKDAQALCEESYNAAGHGSVAANVPLVNLAHVAMLEGNTIEAASLARKALESALLHEDLLTLAWAALELSWPLAVEGDLDRSAHLLAAAGECLARVGARREINSDTCETAVRKILHEHLDADSVQALLDEGRTPPLYEIVRGVLAESSVGSPLGTLPAD
jgi:predicted ATPase/DNA-binding SARP family transcriptional activator